MQNSIVGTNHLQLHLVAKGNNLKELAREVAAADLGLTWSRSDSTFYWYEPGNRPGINLHPKQIGNILIAIGQNM